MKDMLAVGFATNRRPVLGRHCRQHLRAQLGETRQGAVVDEGPGPMAEGVGVLQCDTADGRPSDMCQDGVGIGPAGDAAEIRILDGCSGLALDLRLMVPIGCQAPAVEMAGAAAIPAALDDQGVLGMDQCAFDFGWFCRAESIEPAHVPPSLSKAAIFRPWANTSVPVSPSTRKWKPVPASIPSAVRRTVPCTGPP